VDKWGGVETEFVVCGDRLFCSQPTNYVKKSAEQFERRAVKTTGSFCGRSVRRNVCNKAKTLKITFLTFEKTPKKRNKVKVTTSRVLEATL